MARISPNGRVEHRADPDWFTPEQRCETVINGDCLFESENAKIAGNIERLYKGMRPATLKRYGKSDDRADEVI